MNQENHNDSREQEISDIEQARSDLASLWHKEVNLSETQKTLSYKDQQYQQNLVTHGYEMTALLRSNPKEKSKKERDIHRVRIISGSVVKCTAMEDALGEKQIKVFGIEGESPEDEEKKSHKLLRKMIREHEDQMKGKDVVPSLKIYTPDLYAVDIAEDKACTAVDTYPEDIIFASDVVVLHDSDILEKPKSVEEAKAMLTQISGKEVRISSGSVLIATIPPGKTVLMREGVVMYIELQQYSKEDIEQYLHECKEYKSIAGTIDYSHPAAQRLISQKPVRVEKLAMERGEEPKKEIYIDPALLPLMRDYCIGMPKEMIQEMMRQVEVYNAD